MWQGMPPDTFYVDSIQDFADSILVSCHVKAANVDRCPSFISQGDSLSIGPQGKRAEGGIQRDAEIKACAPHKDVSSAPL